MLTASLTRRRPQTIQWKAERIPDDVSPANLHSCILSSYVNVQFYNYTANKKRFFKCFNEAENVTCFIQIQKKILVLYVQHEGISRGSTEEVEWRGVFPEMKLKVCSLPLTAVTADHPNKRIITTLQFVQKHCVSGEILTTVLLD